MSEINKMKIGITLGDVNGIGIEVVLKTLSDKKIVDYCTPIIYGSSKAISYYRKALDIQNVYYNIIGSIDEVQLNTINIVNIWDEEINISIGEMTEEAARYALESIDTCANDAVHGKIDGMVTAPVNKHNIQQLHPDFFGQTEFLAHKCGDPDSLMFLISDKVKIGLVSNHVPIKDVSNYVNEKNISRKIHLMHNSLKKDFLINKPRIAVLGFNPHAGDNGTIGSEEKEIIIPTVKKMRDEENMLVYGPYPGDGFFGSSNFSSFDGILAMYHDQGLIPFKTLTFGSGVNYTAGISIVRTSPDHGTAYDIAGRGEANESSFRQALFACIDIIKNRNYHGEMISKPLRRQEFSKE